MVQRQFAITASFVGGRLASRTASRMRWPPVVTRRGADDRYVRRAYAAAAQCLPPAATKLAANDLAFVKLAAIRIWLRAY